MPAWTTSRWPLRAVWPMEGAADGVREDERAQGKALAAGSARMRAELEGVRRFMMPWKSQPLGKALEEVLADIRTA